MDDVCYNQCNIKPLKGHYMPTNYEFVNSLASFASTVIFITIVISFVYFTYLLYIAPQMPTPKIPESVDRAVENYVERVIMSSPEDSREPFVIPDEITNPKPEAKANNQKLEDFSDILQAIGFSSTEAKDKVTKLLKENPELTEVELLRKATIK